MDAHRGGGVARGVADASDRNTSPRRVFGITLTRTGPEDDGTCVCSDDVLHIFADQTTQKRRSLFLF
jgi:hypothetical protein